MNAGLRQIFRFMYNNYTKSMSKAGRYIESLRNYQSEFQTLTKGS